MMLDFVRNNTIFRDKYKTHNQAVIVSCYFNPQQSEYRRKAFQAYYESIKHLNHRIIECVIGDAQPELSANENISHVYSDSLLWHKEALLNLAIKNLPLKFEYVFWVDADVLFTNKNWLVDGVKELKRNAIIQPFEYCVHMDQDQLEPSFSMELLHHSRLPNQINPQVWRSFAANYATSSLWQDPNYNNHGHVGFAWAARREVLDEVPLFDRALIGGADHIMAHAAAGQIDHPCITKAFEKQIGEIGVWSRQFNRAAQGKLGFVKGDLLHIWHGDIEKRDYFRRIQRFDRECADHVHPKGENGLYSASPEVTSSMWQYYAAREVMGDGEKPTFLPPSEIQSKEDFHGHGGSFGGAGASGSWVNDSPSTPVPVINAEEYTPFS